MVASVDEKKEAAQKQQSLQQLPQLAVSTMKEKMMATASFRQFQAAVHAKVCGTWSGLSQMQSLPFQ
jgi:hypothetical protein